MPTQQMIASSSSSSSSVSLKKYDVFLSFRGEDTRTNFTSHLYDALIRKKVETFIDNNELQKGDDISPTLTKAIEESYISIVIFSEDYASSKWCLNELIKILECKKDWGQIVIPVFYKIDPSHVRKQTGSYQRAFAKHKRALNLNKWKTALSEAANLVGFDSTKSQNETGLIKDIVEVVLQKLKHRYPFEVQDKGLVRIEKRCEEIESLLKVGSNDVRIIGLWGMGGIGKTTLAKALCAKLCPQFEGWCFLENVRDELKKDGLIVVRHRLFSSLLEEENIRLDEPYVETHSIKRKLFGKKLLIVLDDVATSKQLENLMIDTNILGSGSRVIVTTRDKHIISRVHEIYEVKELNKCDSLELFCLNSFGEKNPKIGYEELSKSAIAYCKGNPLALKVLGARLGPRSKLAWESDLEKLQKIPDMEIHDVLKLSYDDLDRTQKDIFLDIACFFKGWDRDCVISVLEACGLFAKVGVEDLLNKALITISEYNKIKIHDLIQEMGREIINQESIKEPEKRSRLWRGEEVADVLKKNKGTKAIEGIKLDNSEVGDLFLRPDSFKRMTNLRYLEIYNNVDSNVCKIYFIDGLEWLSDKLRYLRWDYFPPECLPSNFSAEMLVELIMKNSKLKKLWDGVQNLVNLKKIELDFSEDLIEMPDLSRATNLQTLSLYHCESLRELCPFILSHPKLEELDLRGCKRIESLKSNVHSKSLRGLYLSDCSSLAEFSVTSEKLMELYLENTGIREIPSPNDSAEIMESLKELHLSGCTHIDALNLSFLLDGIRSLEVLELDGCRNLEALPHNIHKHIELKRLVLDDCRQLIASSLADLIHSSQLQRLSAVNCTLMDTESTQQLMLEKTFSDHVQWLPAPFLLMPGDQVPGKFNFQKAEGASITIPPIPKLNLCGFVFCIILSQGLDVPVGFFLRCPIYEHGEEISNTTIHIGYNVETLISDHVLLCWQPYHSGENGGDHYGLSFEFELGYWNLTGDIGYRESTEGIKRCGVLPVYDKSSNHRVEIVEEEEEEDLNEKSSCGCSIGLVWKYLLERSEEMMWLDLGGTAIREIPSSIWHHRKLKMLLLSDCCEFDFIGNKLSNDSGIIESLKYLYLSGCTHIDALNLSFLLDGIQSLEVLYLDGCRNLEALPHNIHKHIELKELSVVNCTLMDTESTQQLMLERTLSEHVRWSTSPPPILLMPGDQVAGKFNFQKAEGASITIPPIPKSNLKAFMFCIILSQGFDVRRSFAFYSTIYEYGEEISHTRIPIGHNVETLISDHVFLCWHGYHSGENGGDHYSLSFEFKYYYRTVDGCREIWSTEGIKECGVLPVYGLELDDKSIRSRVEIVELESSTAQVCDVGGSSDENEDYQQHLSYHLEEEEEDLNEKSSCGCSIGLVWKYLLERSGLD